jgi:hypothetical protein
MLKKNMGSLDRAVRFILGLVLIAVGLFLLGGLRGSWIGIVVAVVALVPIATAVTGVCPGYVPLGISTLRREHSPPM